MYTIGEVSQICGIAVKTLRYYDEEALVVPDRRDPQNNYRYYSQEQICELVAVRDLRKLGFHIEEIRGVLRHRNAGAYVSALDARLPQIRSQIAGLQEQLRFATAMYERLAGSIGFASPGAGPSYSVTTEYVPECRVVATRYRSPFNARNLFVERMAELQQVRDRYGLRQSGPAMAVFHDHYRKQFTEELGDLEVMMPVARTERERGATRRFGGFVGATTVHVGSYPDLQHAYSAVEGWMAERGLGLAGAAIEQYLIDPLSEERPERYVTRIVLPITPSRTPPAPSAPS